jgi:hypothetical protein
MEEMSAPEKRPDWSPPEGSTIIVPVGENVYSGLRSACVKMDALLEHLGEEKFNGYVLLLGPGEDGKGTGSTEGLLLLQAGQVVGSSYGESWGKEAQTRITERVSYQTGKLDIVSLESETVEALIPSFGQRTPYTDLRTFFVDLDKLVLYLSGVAFSGSISVVGKEGRGVVLLKDGRLVGAYTDATRALSPNLDAIKALGADGEGVIWVSSGQAH